MSKNKINKNGLTVSLVFAAESANYGEGFGNLSVLKKMTRGDSKQYSYISRQALRYNMVQQMGWDSTPVDSKSGVVQFAPEAKIKDYPELDLFGYFKTTSKESETEKGGASSRSAVARLSNAVALEPFKGDMDFLTNIGLASRKNLENAIAQSEINAAYYAYTITIDLDRVGIDGEIKLDNKEKADRVNKLLDTVQYLYRDIKGRRENLSPLFVVGGVYERKNPFFENRIKIKSNQLDVALLSDVINGDEAIKSNTLVGVIAALLDNTDQIKKELRAKSIADTFKEIKREVETYYE